MIYFADTNEECNSFFARIEIEGDEYKNNSCYPTFYNAVNPRKNSADVDGMYRNTKGEQVKAENCKFYSTFSTWDTYRAVHPFYTIVVQEKVDDFVQSMLEQHEVQGFLPIWALWGKETYCMVGNHSVHIIAEAYANGFRGFVSERAFQSIKSTPTVSHGFKSHWATYIHYHYLPNEYNED